MTWKLRMEHNRAWRDAAVESGCCTPPQEPDGPGYLAVAGRLRTTNPAMWEIARKKGHSSMSFDICICQQPPNALARP